MCAPMPISRPSRAPAARVGRRLAIALAVVALLTATLRPEPVGADDARLRYAWDFDGDGATETRVADEDGLQSIALDPDFVQPLLLPAVQSADRG